MVKTVKTTKKSSVKKSVPVKKKSIPSAKKLQLQRRSLL